jgi:tetratricopeptide (TPR) repeat protein
LVNWADLIIPDVAGPCNPRFTFYYKWKITLFRRLKTFMTRFGLILASISLLLLSANFSRAEEPDMIAQADAIFESPSLDFQKGRQALSLYEERLSGSPRLFSCLARASFILGDLANKEHQTIFFEKGLAYAQRLIKEHPNEAAGHYWMALNRCGLANAGRQLYGFHQLPQIEAELKQALKLDENYDQAGPHRVLGRIYYDAPPWPMSVGDMEQSHKHLTTAVRLASKNSTNHLYLAEALLRQGKKDQARRELQTVLQPGLNALHHRALEDDRQEARRLLEELEENKEKRVLSSDLYFW